MHQELILLEHRKSTTMAGCLMLFWTAIVCVAVVSVHRFFFPNLWTEKPLLLFTVYGFMTLGASIAVWIALVNLRTKGVFICRLSDDRLEIQCPIAQFGESFSLRLEQIKKIECEQISGGEGSSPQWYLWDMSDRRYALTESYGNPVGWIVDRILELRPELPIINTGD